MNQQQYKEYKSIVDSAIRDVFYFSTGRIKDCDDCFECDCDFGDCDCIDEGCFMNDPCDLCTQNLAGMSYVAHGYMYDDITIQSKLIHFKVCTDCLHYTNYGRLDDASMIAIETGGVS